MGIGFPHETTKESSHKFEQVVDQLFSMPSEDFDCLTIRRYRNTVYLDGVALIYKRQKLHRIRLEWLLYKDLSP